VTVANFNDNNASAPVDDFTSSEGGSVKIDWGDGQSDSGVVPVAAGSGHFTVKGNHTYYSAGVWSALVTIKDGGGSKTTVSSPVTIGGVEGANQQLTLFLPYVQGGYSSAQINWGDGSSSTTGTIMP